MKVFLQNDEHCQVITVRDGDIDLEHYDDIWDIYLREEFAGIPIDICITGDKADGERSAIDYASAVRVEAYEKESDTNYFRCLSPIIADEHTRELHPITPEELIRQMAHAALPVMADSPYIRDFAYHHAGYVRRTEARHPFLWLVRENGTALYDLTTKEKTDGFTWTMEHYRDRCCLFHYDGCYLRPILPQTARGMLENLQTT